MKLSTFVSWTFILHKCSIGSKRDKKVVCYPHSNLCFTYSIVLRTDTSWYYYSNLTTWSNQLFPPFSMRHYTLWFQFLNAFVRLGLGVISDISDPISRISSRLPPTANCTLVFSCQRFDIWCDNDRSTSSQPDQGASHSFGLIWCSYHEILLVIRSLLVMPVPSCSTLIMDRKENELRPYDFIGVPTTSHWFYSGG